ncbi:MAG: acetate kinase [Candidatus Pacearchaeota archaeon]
MKILTLNCGSSSIKYALFEDGNLLVNGLIEKIGEKGSKIKNYKEGIDLMVKQILSSGKINSLNEIDAVGHRVVHGGMLLKSCIIDKKVLRIIKKFSPLAPLHNPPNLRGIIEMQKILPNVKHVAVFDTAFHQTMPEKAFVYALPYKFYSKYGIRRYGFHGTSHKYISQRAAEILGKKFEDLNIITCHLGAGCSMAAVQKGKVIDTSMGFTPVEGLVMGTRTGDIDAGIIIHIAKKMKMKPQEIDDLINKKSGLLGLTGKGKDFRLVVESYKKGDRKCKLAFDIFCYRIKKYIGAYAAALGNVDAIVFTAGIGENNPEIRSCVCDIECLGIKIDEEKNREMIEKEGIITAPDSKVTVLVIPTNEEKMIALETKKILEEKW